MGQFLSVWMEIKNSGFRTKYVQSREENLFPFPVGKRESMWTALSKNEDTDIHNSLI